jgi:dihydroorotate dehydrogenase (NAD+) catalytic subunit
MQVTCHTGGRTFSLANPVMSAPGGVGNVVEFRHLTDLTKLGAVIPNSLMNQDGAPSAATKFCCADAGFISAYGANNISLQNFIDEQMPLLPDGPKLIVDLKARTMAEMAEMAALAAKTKRIDCIEINLICPYGTGEPAYYSDPDKLKRLVGGVKDVSGGKPVIAKAPGGDFSMRYMAEVLQESGIDMFVSFNCLNGCSIDIRTRTYRCGAGGGGGFFGAGIKPYALSRLREAASAFSIPVIGAGGINSAEDVIEYILAGAFAVQIGSANLKRPDFMEKLLVDLEKLMNELDIHSLDEIRGTAKVAHVDAR